MGVASVIVKAMPTKNQKNTTKIHLISCACITKMGYYILKKNEVIYSENYIKTQ